MSTTLTSRSYLAHHGLLVLLLLCDFDWWLLGNSWNQEIHQDVLTIGHAVHHGQQVGRDIVGEQVVVVPNMHSDKTKQRIISFLWFFYQRLLSCTKQQISISSVSSLPQPAITHLHRNTFHLPSHSLTLFFFWRVAFGVLTIEQWESCLSVWQTVSDPFREQLSSIQFTARLILQFTLFFFYSLSFVLL